MLQHLYGVDGVRTSDDAGDVSESEPGGAFSGVVSMSTAIVMFLESMMIWLKIWFAYVLMFANFDFSFVQNLFKIWSVCVFVYK